MKPRTAMGVVKYSICITHFNNVGTVRESLDSLLRQVDDRFEVIVVDNFSTDGSEKILEEYRSKGKIRLFQKRGSRGVGRESALEESVGQYVISGVDMDDTFKTKLGQLLDFYHAKCDGLFLLTEISTHIAPRELVVQLGGYHDLQFNEIWELCRRSADVGKFRWTIFPLLEKVNEHHEREGKLRKLRYEYVQIRDRYRVGKRPFGGKRGKVRFYQRLLQAIVMLALPFYDNYKDEKFKRFTIVDREFFTDSSAWWPEAKNSKDMRRKYVSHLGMDPNSLEMHKSDISSSSG